MIYDDQPQMVEAAQRRYGMATSAEPLHGASPFHQVLDAAFAAIDREALIEKVVKARLDRGRSIIWGDTDKETELDLIAAGIIPEREPDHSHPKTESTMGSYREGEA